MKAITCEACRQAAVEIEFPDHQAVRPYAVCSACEHRLQTRSLRPLEWFNLAAVHGGGKYLLHDDFYDEDGTAWQPEEEVDSPERFHAPGLDDVRSDLPRLVDYCVTRWRIDEATTDVLRQYSAEQVLDELLRRVDDRVEREVLAAFYTLCELAVGPLAADWLREQARRLPDLIYCWAGAAARCLPFNEAFACTVDALERCELRSLADNAQALACFRSERTLDWIESKFPTTGLPVVEQWGRLAALSQLSWPRVQEWLRYGRPLSLAVLDALNACWHYNTLPLREMQPKLLLPPSLDAASAELNRYLARDSVPRVKMTIPTILAHWEEICAK